MSLIKEKFNTKVPMPGILPKWENFTSTDNVVFNNLDHFIFTVSKLTQEEDDKCGISYKNALDKLLKRESDFPEEEQKSIRNLVRSNLHKRGLITEEVYENFRYSSDGTQVGLDVGRYAAGDPDCVMTPSKQYIDFFYELYIGVSYPWHIPDEKVKENVAKLLATIEELERQHIFIKVNTVLSIENCAFSDGSYKSIFSTIPLFSHKDFKSVSVMSSVVNEKLLRKFYFAIMEDLYGSSLYGHKGCPVELKKTINIGKDLNEIELFETVVKEVGA